MHIEYEMYFVIFFSAFADLLPKFPYVIDTRALFISAMVSLGNAWGNVIINSNMPKMDTNNNNK